MTESEIQEIKELIKEVTGTLVLRFCNAGSKYAWELSDTNKKLLETKTRQIDIDIKTLKSIRHIVLSNDFNPTIIQYFNSIINQIKKSEYLNILNKKVEV